RLRATVGPAQGGRRARREEFPRAVNAAPVDSLQKRSHASCRSSTRITSYARRSLPPRRGRQREDLAMASISVALRGSPPPWASRSMSASGELPCGERLAAPLLLTVYKGGATLPVVHLQESHIMRDPRCLVVFVVGAFLALSGPAEAGKG